MADESKKSKAGRPVTPNTNLPDFVDWSQSAIGFYPGTRYFPRSGVWKDSKEPIRWEKDQIRLFKWLFKFDSKGKLPVDTFFYIDVAKSGKTMLGAAVAQYFGMYVDAGMPGEVIIAANSKDHAGVRTYGTLQRALRRHPFVDDIVDGGIGGILDAGIRFRATGHVAKAVPKNAGTQAGLDPVLRHFDEGWRLNVEMDSAWIAEMKPSLTRNVSFGLHTTYTGYWGDGGYLTQTISNFYNEDGTPTDQARVVEGLEDLPLLVVGNTGLWWNHDPHRYSWITPAELEKQRQNYRHIPNEFRRHYFAEIVQSEEAFVPPVIWARCTDNDWEGADPRKGKREAMVLGVDLASVKDTCGVVGRGYDPDTNKLPLMVHRKFDPKDYKGEITGYILNEVKQYILDVHRQYNVVAVYYDGHQALYMANELIKAGVNMVEVKQSLGAARDIADNQYRQLIFDGRLRNYPNAGDLQEHVLAAVGETKRDMTVRIRKDKTSKKIDLAVADSMACLGVLDPEIKRRLIALLRNGDRPKWKPRPRLFDTRVTTNG